MSGLKPITINDSPEKPANIYAEDDAAIYQSIFGEDGVSSIGEHCKATLLSNNKIRIADGVLCVGGHFARIPFGDYVDCEIMNGESGKKRNDLIVAKFSTTGYGGIDTMELNVIQGTPGESGTDPEVKSGNLYKEEKIREVPLYRVRIEGLNIIAVEPMFEIMPTNEELRKKLDELNSNLTQSTPGKFILPGGLKIFWGEAVTSGSKDPANMYSVQVSFPESFSSDSYFFTACIKLMQSTDPTKWDTAVNYYERTKSRAWIGSSAHARTTFSWLAIGY